MGADFVFGRRNRGHSVDRVAFCRILIEEISSGEFHFVRVLLCSMRAGALSGADDRLPRLARFYWWSTDFALIRCDPDLSTPFEAAHRHGVVQHYGDLCSCDWASHRRLADRQLRMALCVLHERYSGTPPDCRRMVHDGKPAHEPRPAQ